MLPHYFAKVRNSSFAISGKKCKRKCNMHWFLNTHPSLMHLTYLLTCCFNFWFPLNTFFVNSRLLSKQVLWTEAAFGMAMTRPSFTSDNGKGKCNCPPCLSVCLSVSKIIQKRVHGFGWHFACRQVSGHGRTGQLLSAIRIIVRIPEPYCFLRYRIYCNAEFCYVGYIPRAPVGRRSSDA